MRGALAPVRLLAGCGLALLLLPWPAPAAAPVLVGGANAYVTGFTESADFPTSTGAFDTTLGGVHDAFVTKLALPFGPADQ